MSHSHHNNRNIFGIASGLAISIVSTSAALAALQFDNESRMFPLVIAAMLAIIGLAMALHAFLKSADKDQFRRGIQGVLPAAAIIALWAMAFSGGAGFVLPTFCMQASLLWLTGQRKPFFVAAVAALVTGLAYGLFVVLLDTPLPPSYLPDALQGF